MYNKGRKWGGKSQSDNLTPRIWKNYHARQERDKNDHILYSDFSYRGIV